MSLLKKWSNIIIRKINIILPGLAFLAGPSLLYANDFSTLNCTKPFSELNRFTKTEIFENCKELKQILEPYKNMKLGIGIASEYPSNVASLFGHTFLILINDNLVMSQTISYLAQTNDAGVFKMIVYGLSKKFSGKYQILPFYKLDTVYHGIESRNLFIYKIKDSVYDLDHFLFNLIENERHDGNYHFFNYNCVTGIKKILKPVLRNNVYLPERQIDYPEYLIEDLKEHLELYRVKYSAEKLLSTEDIKSKDRRSMKSLFKSNKKIIAKSDAENKYIKALYDYYSFKAESLDEHKKLRDKFVFYEADTEKEEVIALKRPSFGATRLHLGVVENNKKAYLHLKFSPSYKNAQYREIDNYSNNSLILMESEFYQSREAIYLTSINFIDLENTPNFVWPILKPSWKFSINYDNAFNLNNHDHNINSKFFMGISRSYEDLSLSLIGGPKLIYRNKISSAIGVFGSLIRIQKQSYKFKFILEIEADNLAKQDMSWTQLYMRPSVVYPLGKSFLELQHSYRSLNNNLIRESKLSYVMNF